MSEVLIRLFEDSKGTPTTCRACGAPIEWYETIVGKRMPMDRGAVPRKSDRDNGRVVAFFAASDSHWATCPESDSFKRSRSR